MAARVPEGFKLRENGDPLPSAIVRLDPGHGFQIFEGASGQPARIHAIFNLYASQASFEAGEPPLVDRYSEVDVYASKPEGMKLGTDERSGPNVDTERVRIVSSRVNEMLRLCKAVAYEVFHEIPGKSDFTSDELTIAQAKETVLDSAAVTKQ